MPLSDRSAVSSMSPSVPNAVDPAIATILATSVQKMKAILAGNGMDSAVVRLKVTPSAGDAALPVRIYHFSARTSVRLMVHTTRRTETGRITKGEILPMGADLSGMTPYVLADIRLNPVKRKQVTDLVVARPDKGFGLKDQNIKIPALQRQFVQHEKCGSCHASGRLGCAKCSGRGAVSCTSCHSRKQIMCPRCRGSGRVHAGKNISPCQACRGDGRISCPKCAGRGQIKCASCGASGALACGSCAGSGWLSQITHIDVSARMAFDMDRTGLPQPLIHMLDVSSAQMARYVTRREMDVKVVSAAHMARSYLGEEEPADTIWMDYDVTCPFGRVSFDVKGRDLSGYVFGYQARLAKFPYFLDAVTKTGQTALITAATSRKQVTENLQVATRFAFLRGVLTDILVHKDLAKVRAAALAKYPVGLNPQGLTDVIAAADMCLRHTSRTGRTVGLVIGQVVFLILATLYFIIGGRLFLLAEGMPLPAVLMLDVALPAIGIGVTVLCSKITARVMQNKMLRRLLPTAVLSKTLPKIGHTAIWAVVASAVVYGMVLGAGVMMDAPVPEWLRVFIHKIASLSG